MGAWQGLGKARIGVGILVNIGWLGVPKNVGPQDRSKWKSAMLAEQISAWRPQKRCFRQKTSVFGLNLTTSIFHYLGVPLGPIGPYWAFKGLLICSPLRPLLVSLLWPSYPLRSPK